MRTAPGHEVYKIEPAQVEEWRKATAPLTASWAEGAKKAGVDPEAAQAELKAAIAKYGAGM